MIENYMVVGPDWFDDILPDVEECPVCHHYIGDSTSIEQMELDKCTCEEEE